MSKSDQLCSSSRKSHWAGLLSATSPGFLQCFLLCRDERHGLCESRVGCTQSPWGLERCCSLYNIHQTVVTPRTHSPHQGTHPPVPVVAEQSGHILLAQLEVKDLTHKHERKKRHELCGESRPTPSSPGGSHCLACRGQERRWNVKKTVNVNHFPQESARQDSAIYSCDYSHGNYAKNAQ